MFKKHGQYSLATCKNIAKPAKTQVSTVVQNNITNLIITMTKTLLNLYCNLEEKCCFFVYIVHKKQHFSGGNGCLQTTPIKAMHVQCTL